MPNRYLPSALTDMVEEVHEDLLAEAESKDDGSDEYVSEYEALVSMMKPQHQREFRSRRGELDDG